MFLSEKKNIILNYSKLTGFHRSLNNINDKHTNVTYNVYETGNFQNVLYNSVLVGIFRYITHKNEIKQ